MLIVKLDSEFWQDQSINQLIIQTQKPRNLLDSTPQNKNHSQVMVGGRNSQVLEELDLNSLEEWEGLNTIGKLAGKNPKLPNEVIFNF